MVPDRQGSTAHEIPNHCISPSVTIQSIQMILFGIKFRFCNLYSYESTLMNRHRKFLFSKLELLLSINPLFQHNQEMHSFDVCMTRSLKFTFSYKIFIDLKSIFYTGAKRHFFQNFLRIVQTQAILLLKSMSEQGGSDRERI